MCEESTPRGVGFLPYRAGLSLSSVARYGAGVKPYTVVYKDALNHGVVLGVSLPEERAPVPPHVLEQLHPDERAFAASLRGFRQVHWVGGRLAAHAAFQLLGHGGPPVLTDPWGAPTSRHGLSISISHKKHLAVALVARDDHGSLGVDLEDLLPERSGIAERILRPAELAAVALLPPERRWTATVLRFSIKEAIYKALAPRQRRYIDFQEAEVTPNIDGTADVQMFLEAGPHPVAIEARYNWLYRSVLSTVRAHWSHP